MEGEGIPDYGWLLYRRKNGNKNRTRWVGGAHEKKKREREKQCRDFEFELKAKKKKKKTPWLEIQLYFLFPPTVESLELNLQVSISVKNYCDSNSEAMCAS